ncbi:MAG: tetratricopeptide repeat protein [Candidatus Omnitrophota bacterium]
MTKRKNHKKKERQHHSEDQHPSSATETPPGRKWIIFSLICILVLTFVSFLPTLKNGFLYFDDDTHLIENPQVRSLSVSNIKRIFTSAVNETYIPLSILSFAAEFHFFGYNPHVYHLDNLLIHLTVVALVFWLALRMGLTLRASLLVALLFGIHPMRVESVAWVTERKDVLYAAFYLLALHSYWSYLHHPKVKYFILAMILGILSMLAKAMALSLPLILLLMDWYVKRKFSWKIVLEKIPFFLYCAGIGWITYRLNIRMPVADTTHAGLIWIWSFSFYFEKFFFPWPLIPLYFVPQPFTLANSDYLLSFIIFFSLIFFLVRFRKNRLFVFAIAYYVLSIFFLMRSNTSETNAVADRFMYLPCLGLCFFLGVRLDGLLKNSRTKTSWLYPATTVLVILLYFNLACLTWQQTKVWSDTPMFAAYSLKQLSPVPIRRGLDKRFIFFVNRGKYYEVIGKYTLALNDYTEAIKLAPTQYVGYFNRGNIHFALKQYAAALKDYTKSINLNGQQSFAYAKRGSTHLELGQVPEALEDFNKAIDLDPKNASAYDGRGVILGQQGRLDEAYQDFNRAIVLNPFYAEAYANRGLYYYFAGDLENAVKDLDKAISLKPNLTYAYATRAAIYEKTGHGLDALSDQMKLKFPFDEN